MGIVVKGLDVLHGIYTGYNDEPDMRWLDSTNVYRPAQVPDAPEYLASWPKMDSFKKCTVTRDSQPDSDPTRLRLKGEL